MVTMTVIIDNIYVHLNCSCVCACAKFAGMYYLPATSNDFSEYSVLFVNYNNYWQYVVFLFTIACILYKLLVMLL